MKHFGTFKRFYLGCAFPVTTATLIGNTINGLDISFGNMREHVKQGREYKSLDLIAGSIMLTLNIVVKGAAYGLIWPFLSTSLIIKKLYVPSSSTVTYNSLSMKTRTVPKNSIMYQLIPHVSQKVFQ